MRTVDIPGGQATFRERSELRGRDRSLIEAAAMAAAPALGQLPDGLQREEGEADEDYNARVREATKDLQLTRQQALALIEVREASVVATLASWTLDIPLPTMETIGDLPAELYEGLQAAVGGQPLGSVDFEPPDPRQPEFEDSPTSPSSSSASLWTGEGEKLTPEQRNGTEAIAIDEFSRR